MRLLHFAKMQKGFWTVCQMLRLLVSGRAFSRVHENLEIAWRPSPTALYLTVTLSQAGCLFKEVIVIRIRELRKKAGLTVTQLANRVGVTHPAVVAWEQGRRLPSAGRLPMIAAALGCKIDDLFTDAS